MAKKRTYKKIRKAAPEIIFYISTLSVIMILSFFSVSNNSALKAQAQEHSSSITVAPTPSN